MIISPPFLPARATHQLDEKWLMAVMEGGQPGRGSYPVSYKLGWHGGIHIEAPADGHRREVVRAIADGTVVYVRKPTDKPNPMKDDHPLNYYRGWTSDGCVVIRHDTEIGADTHGKATSVTFYSIIMHLHSIRPELLTGRQIKIYRKDEIGQAGYFYGDPNKIHFEIICDDENLKKLIGRTSGDLNTESDGRLDAIYGEMYFRLPERTEIYQDQPPANVVTPESPPIYTLSQPLYVGLRYAGGEGDYPGGLSVTTYREDGTTIGESLPENEAEYNLYKTATDISKAYSTANAQPGATQTPVPAPSAVYELLRFGRVIGPDVLDPPNTPHWRKIRVEDGEGWVNLNAPGITKFSDGDFPHWKGWTLIDDSADLDSRCDSPTIKGWLDGNGDGEVSHGEAMILLSEEDIQAKMGRTICKLPTEWERATVDARWEWLKTQTIENPLPLTETDFLRLREHIETLAFWEDANIGISTNHWHFHPREFIQHMRMCGWLSPDELARCIPRNCRLGSTPWETASIRGEKHNVGTSKMFRKYGIITAHRQVHVLAQIYIETGLLRLVREGGRGAPNTSIPMAKYYAAFYGRGYLQLTWPSNYEAYGIYRNFPVHTGEYSDTRITQTSHHTWHSFNLTRERPHMKLWSPRYDPDFIATDPFSIGDSAGYYWVSKKYKGTDNMNRLCDFGLESRFIGFASWLVNGGGFGYKERHQFARYLFGVLGDQSPIVGLEQWSYPPLNAQLTASFPPPQVLNKFTVNVDHEKQIP